MKITETNCDDCIHSKMCKDKWLPRNLKNKFLKTQCGDGPNDDYCIKDLNFNVDVDFKCPDFMPISKIRDAGAPGSQGVRIIREQYPV